MSTLSACRTDVDFMDCAHDFEDLLQIFVFCDDIRENDYVRLCELWQNMIKTWCGRCRSCQSTLLVRWLIPGFKL